MKIIIAIVIVALAGIWAFNDRRELMMHYMTWTSAGAPPALLDKSDEGDAVTWFDDYFTIEEVAPGTYALGEPRYAQQNYSYLIIGENKALLFDAGPGVRDIRQAAESLTDKPITFLASHFHYDHVGNNVSFEEIAVLDLPHIRRRAPDNNLTLTTMEHLGGAEGFDLPTWEVAHWWPPGHKIELGSRTLWLLYTPGHTTDSVSLWDPARKMLFSGDYIYPGFLYGFLPNSNMRDYLTTAQTLLSTLPTGTRLYGAHRHEGPGAPVLAYSDLTDLEKGLQGMEAGEIEGQGSYPQSFPINDNMMMLAEPRALQEWQQPGLAHDATLDPATAMRLRIETQMLTPERHRFDLPRDAARKPFESFQFLGLEAGMVALDVGAYAGYTTEMLAAAVGRQGKVYSHNTEAVLERYADGYYKRTMTERLADNRLPNTQLHISAYDDLGLEAQIDIAFLGNTLHDFYYQVGEQQTVSYLKSIYQTLKPGGVLGITDHQGTADADNAKLHRMPQSIAEGLIEAAGFEIAATSGLFHNPADDHTLMVYDERIYRNTDRFFIKAVKPASP